MLLRTRSNLDGEFNLFFEVLLISKSVLVLFATGMPFPQQLRTRCRSAVIPPLPHGPSFAVELEAISYPLINLIGRVVALLASRRQVPDVEEQRSIASMRDDVMHHRRIVRAC